MNNKALFEACTTQCIWCLEQWPIITYRNHFVHVAPFTQDPLLFHHACAAESIRKGLKYASYNGGKKIKWTPPSATSIKRTLDAYHGRSEKSGMGKSITSPKSRSFWRIGVEASIEVASWPAWTRSMSAEEAKKVTDPAKVAEDLKRNRQELLFYDAMDYWTRQPCTDNLQYRPHWNEKRTNLATPSCNHGFGCSTCWERYEKRYDEISKDWD